MVRLIDLLKEVTDDAFFNDKVALRFPTVVSKDIKHALQGINLWEFAWKEANFDSRSDTFKKYNNSIGGGDANDLIAIKKSDFNRVVSAIKNNKMQDRFKSFLVKEPWSKLLQLGRFSKFLRDNNAYNKYKTTVDGIDFSKFNDVTKSIWNSNKQKEFGALKVKGAYYHVSANDNLKPGDIIKPYFDSKKYVKSTIGGSSMGNKMEMAFKFIESFLEENRPSSAPSREKTTYVFKTIDDAVEYLHGGGRPIYAVKPLGDVYFVDMKLIDEMNHEVNSYAEDIELIDDKKEEDRRFKEYKSTMNKLAKQYWAQKASGDPVWEGLTKENIEVIKKVRG